MTTGELLARAEIARTLAQYCSAMDLGRFEEVLSVLAPNVYFEVPPAPAVNGQAQVRSYLADLTGRMRQSGRNIRLHHHLTTSRIELEADGSARGWNHFLAIGPDGLDHAGLYTDVYVADGERWLIARRRISIHWHAAQSPVIALMVAPGPQAAPQALSGSNTK